MKFLPILLLLILFPLHALAQEPAPAAQDDVVTPPAPQDTPTTAQDSAAPSTAVQEISPASSMTMEDFAFLDYYDYNFQAKDWFGLHCPYKICDCAKCTYTGFGGPIPKKDKNEAIEIVENILEYTRTNIRITDDRCITVSAGIQTSTDNMSFEELLQAVDNHLYTAKCTGKNRLVY